MANIPHGTYFDSANADYIEQLYQQFLHNPQLLDSSWQDFFSSLDDLENKAPPPPDTTRIGSDERRSPKRQIPYLLQYIDAYRSLGYLQARLDPLNLMPHKALKELDYHTYGFTDADVTTTFPINHYAFAIAELRLEQLIAHLHQTYCDSLSLECMHLNNSDERAYLLQKQESLINTPLFSPDEQREFLQELIAANNLERYLATHFVGAKRFSLEGCDSLIVLLKEIIRHSLAFNIENINLGMAHRGRLNTLVNVMGKDPAKLFAEFYDDSPTESLTGDVKYHKGLVNTLNIKGKELTLNLAYNPSHLEIISPVVMGITSAQQQIKQSTAIVLPVTIHGDSSLSGQGVAYETFNMSQTTAFGVGGSIRIVINNQVGFTTSEINEMRSTQFCSDLAKVIKAPIIRVNADDVEKVAFAARMALEYRQKFAKDIVIELVGYRRYGHNEADEPMATQPLMYHAIQSHPRVCDLYAEQLQAQQIISADDYQAMKERCDQKFIESQKIAKAQQPLPAPPLSPQSDYTQPLCYPSGYEKSEFYRLGEQVNRLPQHIKAHRLVQKIYDDRLLMNSGEKAIDWGFAETMAYATLLKAGQNIRLCGEDSQRGTFFHRHAVVFDQTSGQKYTPLRTIEHAARCHIYNSMLSEEAVLAFEYGYSLADPQTLVIWEAQFGDFANGAQIVIDQFIASGLHKWAQISSLTLLLPHGYEGQGPEHSSAFIGRYLQLCAQGNIQLCIPSTPAQIYHLLRRQQLATIARPLIVITPKSLLRNPHATSSLEQLTDGAFYPVIDDASGQKHQKTRIILCSGKLYYDLYSARATHQLSHIALIRLEQLYPFPRDELTTTLSSYPHAQDIIFCQEEPKNHGAWYMLREYLEQCINTNQSLHYEGRKASAAAAVGSAKRHSVEQQSLLMQALGIKDHKE